MKEGKLGMKQRREKMKKKAIVLALVLSAGVFVSTVPADACIALNGSNLNGNNLNGVNLNGLSPTSGLDFTTISRQGLGK